MAVDDLGSFNVLIGKNNAGKSTILGAVDGFFRALQQGGVVNLDPPLGAPVDFFDSQEQAPIRLSLSFRLDGNELHKIQAGITQETPQLEEAARSLTSDHILRVTMQIAAGRSPFSFVESIQLLHGEDVRVLLGISEASARELQANQAEQRENTGDKAFLKFLLNRLDQEEWNNYRTLRGGAPLQTWARRRSGVDRLTPEMERHVNGLWTGLESFDAFRSEVAALADSLEQAIEAAISRDLEHSVKTFGGEEPGIPGYAAELLGDIAGLRVHYLRERREPIGREEAERLLELKVKRGGLERLQEIQSTVSGLLGVGIDAFEGGDRQRTSSAEMDVDDFVVQVNGAGIREALRIVLDVEFWEPDILLVEEPEIHLHPAMETSLMQYLKRIGLRTQVAISTHSTNFLDVADMRNVYLVSKDGKETSVQLLDPANAEAEIPRELGIRLSSLFMYDRLVFVEGPTDEAVLREWATTLGANLSYANVGFVSMGGARNFAYFAAERTLAFLSNRQVDVWFVLDRDERDDEDVERMTALAGSHPHLMVLKRRELENYLVNPRALVEFIGIKRELAGKKRTAVTEEDIKDALQDSADELRELAVQKRVERLLGGPLYFGLDGSVTEDELAGKTSASLSEMKAKIEDRETRVESTVAEVQDELGTSWKARKLELVPGDELLDVVCRKWDVRYRKERGDGARLAALMKQDEIPLEMRDFLAKVAQ